jgi:lipoate-protein ligase A
VSVVETLRVFHHGSEYSAAMNMAIDEALLLELPVPAVRFYGWRQPAISFGYFSRFADVEGHAAERELVRRWTGGGIVFHGTDLTYSFTVPFSHPLFREPALQIYTKLHRAIENALRDAGIAAALADAPAPRVSDACFANAVRADVLVNGRKVAGAAHRRSRAGLLHQGSIQVEHLAADFARIFASKICPAFETPEVDADLIGRARSIADQKYGTREWLMRR